MIRERKSILLYKNTYHDWLAWADDETRQELLALTDEKEIEDRFYKDLEFGTGEITCGRKRATTCSAASLLPMIHETIRRNLPWKRLVYFAPQVFL